jgi:nucleoside-diphosphate-sugar epimerase
MRITLFGANGPTGRLLTTRSLAAGHDVTVLTRHPGDFPLRDERLRVVGGDVLDQAPVEDAVRGADAVLSALGVPFGKTPVQVYSRGAERILEAMKRADVARFVTVTSSAVTGEDEPSGGWLFNRVLQPYVTKKLGRTVYDDMRRMEDVLAHSDVDWTVLRPSGLYDLPTVTAYSLTAEHGPGRFTARVDLADALLRQVDDRRFLRGVAHVITLVDNPSLLAMMLREARPKKPQPLTAHDAPVVGAQ